jgi:soluble lytic murein transglycosylase-like protein
MLISALAFVLLPGSAFAQSPAREALYALNGASIFALQTADYSRFFDQGPRWVGRSDVPMPARVELPRAAVPFVVDIPAAPPAAFARAFNRLLARAETDRYDALIRARAVERGLDPRLVKSVIAAESEFSPRAQSPAGALGLMQVMPETAGSVGVERRRLFDPAANIRAGTAYLAYLFARAWQRYHLKGVEYGRAPAWLVQRVVAAYNAGPRFLVRRPLYRQTREYVKRVLLFYRSAVTALSA